MYTNPIVNRIAQQAAERPDAAAMASEGASAHSACELAYGELIEQMDASAAALRGVARRGELVAIVMTAEAEAVAALLAAAQTGNPAVLIPSTLPLDESAALLRRFNLSLAYLPAAVQVAWSDLNAKANGGGWARIASAEPCSFLSIPGALVAQLTSGSMGSSRLAVRTTVGVLSEIEAVIERLAFRTADTVLCASSIAHSYGLIGGLLAPLSAGARVVLARDAQAALRFGTRIPPTVIFGIASTYRELLAAPHGDAALSQNPVALSAGAPLPSGLFDAFLQRFGVPVRQDYGTTETGTISIDLPGEATPTCVGRPLSHLEVRLVRPRDVELEPGEEGDIQVRSAAVAAAYLTPEGPIGCTGEDGWYSTRDAGRFDELGRLYVGGRIREPIWVDGVSVRPEKVERAIRRLEGVREVVALPTSGSNDRTGIKVVVVAPGIEAETIRNWWHEHLSAQEQPVALELRDDLPRSPAGKILQKYLL